jgi:hypothetical protein
VFVALIDSPKNPSESTLRIMVADTETPAKNHSKRIGVMRFFFRSGPELRVAKENCKNTADARRPAETRQEDVIGNSN